MQNEIQGNVLGLKPAQLERLRHTFRRRVDANEIISAELARHISEISRELNRQIGLLIDRRGVITHVIVGDAGTVTLPDIGRARAGHLRLRGLRFIHTHLKGEPLTRDDLTDLALLRFDLVAAITVRPDGLPGAVEWAHLLPENPQGEFWKLHHLPHVNAADVGLSSLLAGLENELGRAEKAISSGGRERAILVGLSTRGKEAAEESMAELKELASSAGVEVLDCIVQARRDVDPHYFIGRGKLQDLVLRSMQKMATMIVFDADLMPSQARHIADETSLKILDRTQLILDIFASRATSADGKLQVELAQLKYLMPRLVGRDTSLSRLMGGGVGGRGPGETKLEIDRRRARERITALEKRIRSLAGARNVRRQKRGRRDLPVISIVGYTNAGKSTLLNALTDSSVLAESKLFATLDPVSRRLRFPREREVIITDTVGFIRDLPPDLVNAFRATLEELQDADLLLHVVDVSDPRHEAQAAAVEKILGDLDLLKTPRLVAYNKCDRLPPGTPLPAGGILISALNGTGFPELLEACERILWREGKTTAELTEMSESPESDAVPQADADDGASETSDAPQA